MLRIATISAASLSTLFVALGVGQMSISHTARPAVRYTIREVPIPAGSSFADAIDVNSRGEAVGFVGGPSGSQPITIVDDNVAFLDDLGGLHNHAVAVNEFGQVAGASQAQPWWGWRAVRWEADGSMSVVLPLTGDIHDNCYAEAINNRGQIVGQSDVQAGFWHAFMWDEEHGTVDLGSLDGSYSGAMDINDHGVAVGWSRTVNGGEAPFVWRDGVMTALRTLPGAELAGGDANAINNHGMIVGHSNGETYGVVHATLWDEHGNPSAIDDLGALASIAHDINDAGTIVGELVFEDGSRSAFIHQNGRTRDLNDLLPASSPWTVDRAIAVSNDGRIVGSGFIGAEYRTFIMEPVPVKAKLTN